MTRRPALLFLALVSVAITGCSDSAEGGDSATHVTVFAASSLTNAFTEAGQDHEQRTGERTTFSFAGSQDLVAQIQQGAPADVIATADTKTMDEVADDVVDAPHVLAHNQLVIVTAAGNPHDVQTLDDLADPDLVVVLADPSVPAGSYAAQALDAAKVEVDPKSLELDVRSVLTKVEVGEADVGIVYATDAKSAADKVTAVPLADAPEATYEIAPVTEDGRGFVDYLLSPPGQAVLARYGFLPP